MNKNLVLLLAILLSAACHRNAAPQKTTNKSITVTNSNAVVITTVPNTANTNTNNVPETPPAKIIPAAMIVIDGYGRVLTPQAKLPNDPNIKPDYSKISRAFTPQQMANLKARFKTIPPRVLYVPEAYAKKSYKGTYCIYKKTFWYWKKEDGLFYLDESDYN